MGDKPGKIATIRIEVSVAVGNMWMGESKLSLDIPTEHLKHVRPESFDKDIEKLVKEALENYNFRNGLD